MKTTKTLMAVAILGMIALTGTQAQTITGTIATGGTAVVDPNAGTYKDSKLSIPQRLQLAHSVLSSGTAPGAVAAAAGYMLSARPVMHLLKAWPEFADSVLADPSLGGLISDPNDHDSDGWAMFKSSLAYRAIAFKTDAIADVDAQLAYLQPLLDSPLLSHGYTGTAKAKYSQVALKKAQIQSTAGDYSGAIATALSVTGWNPDAVGLILKAKLALRSPDVLSWAKLHYIMQGFGSTQAGIDAVSSAFRSLDTGLVRANAFIQFQKDGVGTNPLAGVAFPAGIVFIGNSPSVNALNAGIGGDNLAALKIAASAFAAAPSGNALNNATAFVAQWLRNIDANLVRANAFVSAQSAGQAYSIAELSR